MYLIGLTSYLIRNISFADSLFFGTDFRLSVLYFFVYPLVNFFKLPRHWIRAAGEIMKMYFLH
jgi:hypothetical protein